LRRSCKNAKIADPNGNKGGQGAAAEGHRPPFVFLAMAFGAFLRERRNNLGGVPPSLELLCRLAL